MPVTSGIERAFALSSVTRTSIIEALLKKWATEEEIKSSIPNLLQAMPRWLVYRGFRPKDEGAKPTTLTSTILWANTKSPETTNSWQPTKATATPPAQTWKWLVASILGYPTNEKLLRIEAWQNSQPITQTISEWPTKTTIADLLRLSRK
jgi:hypothetical protein